jgi:cytochrome oxidase assembly protein ShyY1
MMFVSPPMIFVTHQMIFVLPLIDVFVVINPFIDGLPDFRRAGILPRRGFIIVEKGSSEPRRRKHKNGKRSNVLCVATPKHKN